MKKYFTWQEIYQNAEGSSFGEQDLKIKDNARAELEDLMQTEGLDSSQYERDRRRNRRFLRNF